MNKKVLILGAVVVLAGAGGAAAFFMTRGPKPAHAETEAKAEAEGKKPAGIVDMETFVVNLNSPSADRFAKLSVRLTVVPAEKAEELGHDPVMQARMRDRVLTLLTSKTADDLAGPMGKEGLRREIKVSLGALVEGGEIEEVLFSDFVVQ